MKHPHQFEAEISIIGTASIIATRYFVARFIESLVGNLLIKITKITKNYIKRINSIQNEA